MQQYEFRFSVDAWSIWKTEANDIREARKKFISTTIAEFELQDIETPIHQITVRDSAGHVTEVLDEAECAKLTPRE